MFSSLTVTIVHSMRADSFFMHFILKNDASGSFLSMHGNRKVGSAEPTSEERVKRNEKSASASTTGVAVRATQTVATEEQKKDDPASTVGVTIKQTASASVTVATEGQKKDNPENAASTSVIVVCSASAGCCC